MRDANAGPKPMTHAELRRLAALVRVLVQVGVAVVAVTLIGLVWWTRGW